MEALGLTARVTSRTGRQLPSSRPRRFGKTRKRHGRHRNAHVNDKEMMTMRGAMMRPRRPVKKLTRTDELLAASGRVTLRAKTTSAPTDTPNIESGMSGEDLRVPNGSVPDAEQKVGSALSALTLINPLGPTSETSEMNEMDLEDLPDHAPKLAEVAGRPRRFTRVSGRQAVVTLVSMTETTVMPTTSRGLTYRVPMIPGSPGYEEWKLRSPERLGAMVARISRIADVALANLAVESPQARRESLGYPSAVRRSHEECGRDKDVLNPLGEPRFMKEQDPVSHTVEPNVTDARSERG